MDAITANQRLRAVAIPAITILGACFAGLCIGSGDYSRLLLVVIAVLLLLFWFGAGELFWPIVIASSFLAGTFPILGGSFNTFQILMGLGVARFLIEEVVFKHRRLARVRGWNAILLWGFMAVLTFHALKDRFGMRFLGSDIWGGRNYVNVYVGLAAFFVIQTVTIKSKTWAKLPYLILAVTMFDALIAIVTTLFPSTIYTIYPFYSAVSASGISEIVTGEAVDTARVVTLGNFGYVLILLVLASVSLRRLLSPRYLLRHFLLAIGFAAVLFSSFRTMVFNTVAAVILAAVRDLRWGALAFLPIVAGLLFGLSLVNSVKPLPKQIQRSLAFMPGQWDAEMKLDTAASNDYREQVWTVWQREYFPLHPWIGRGFGFRSESAQGSSFQADPSYYKLQVEIGNIHNGFFATLDALGVIGAVFFIAWNLRLLVEIFKVSFKDLRSEANTLRFVALYLGTAIVCYWIGAQNVGAFLPQEFVLAGVLLRLLRETRSRSGDERLKTQTTDQVQRQFSRA